MPTTDLYISKISSLSESNPSFQQFAISIAKQTRTSLRERFLPQDLLAHFEESFQHIQKESHLEITVLEFYQGFLWAVLHQIM